MDTQNRLRKESTEERMLRLEGLLKDLYFFLEKIEYDLKAPTINVEPYLTKIPYFIDEIVDTLKPRNG